MLAATTTTFAVINPNVVAFILTILIPVATQLLVKAHNIPVKVVVSLILAGLVEFFKLHRGVHGEVSFSGQELYDYALTIGIAVLSYLHIWQPVFHIDTPTSTVGKALMPTKGLG